MRAVRVAMVASAWSMRASIAAHNKGVLVEPAGHGVLELGDLLMHRLSGHLGQDCWVALTGDESADHLAPGLGQHVRRHTDGN